MRFLACFATLITLMVRIQGIRFQPGLVFTSVDKIQFDKNGNLMQEGLMKSQIERTDAVKYVLSRDTKFSENGIKLMTRSILSAEVKLQKTNAELKNSSKRKEDHKQNLIFTPPPVHPSLEDPKSYPDVLDLSGMDYSPAKRKTPIHN